jgi:hypothetical protein
MVSGVQLWQFLAALNVAACIAGNWRLLRVSLTLLGNWCVLTFYASVTGDQFNVAVNAAVDYVCVFSVLPICNRWQAAFVITWAVAMTFHALYAAARAFNPVHADMIRYWWRFHYLAWSQALLVLLWLSEMGFRYIRDRLADWRRRKPVGTRGHLVRREGGES